jgi:hypothetical protein
MEINYTTLASHYFGWINDHKFTGLFGVTPFVSDSLLCKTYLISSAGNELDCIKVDAWIFTRTSIDTLQLLENISNRRSNVWSMEEIP